MELNSGRRKGEQESYTRQKKTKNKKRQGLSEGYLTGADGVISD